jgi:transposase
MSPKRTYFGFSTAQRRKLLFETWEATGSVTQACQKERVSRGLFYYWKKRFDQKVIEMRCEQPDWGKARISQEMVKANNWVPLVSLNTVKHILEEAGLWPKISSREKKTSGNRDARGGCGVQRVRPSFFQKAPTGMPR